jgi:hypothetical protein
MSKILDFPLLLFAATFILLCFSAYVGGFIRERHRPLEKGEREDLGVVQAAAVTLLSLLIGFSFSMAISRYDQRKTFEEAEANAIGTEYVRADVFPAGDAAKVRALLKSYLDQRILFYTTRDDQALRKVNDTTAQLQNELWSSVQVPAMSQPASLMAMTSLAVSGMNDVLNSQGYTQAAWWNRIPVAAWVLLEGIAIGCNLLVGYGTHRTNMLLIVLPLAVSVSFFLIADIDSPRGGVIRVQPQNLISLAHSIPAQ